MKKLFLLSILAGIIIVSCSFEKPQIVASSPEAFAYQLDEGWEVNATVNVKGFIKQENDEEFSASFDYFVDLIGPDGLMIESIFTDSKEVTDNELIDVQLEAQFELDYNSTEGIYIIIFNIIDNNSGEKASAQAEFELKK